MLAISDSDSHEIRVFDVEKAASVFTFRFHKQPIVGILFHPSLHFLVSLDQAGVFAYWLPQDGALPKNAVEFRFMIATDLYVFRKNKVQPLSLSASPSGSLMAVFGLDWKVGAGGGHHEMYIFGVTTGKLLRTIDESDAAYESLFAAQGLLIDAFHFAKRLKLEATIREKVPISGIPEVQAATEGLQSPINCVFDRSEHFAVYGSPFGVKTVNVRLWRGVDRDFHGENRGTAGRSRENRAVPERFAVPGRFARVLAAADRSEAGEEGVGRASGGG